MKIDRLLGVSFLVVENDSNNDDEKILRKIKITNFLKPKVFVEGFYDNSLTGGIIISFKDATWEYVNEEKEVNYE